MNIGDIVDIPYQEGDCVHCGWIVTRDRDNEPWTGQLGGDCRHDPDGTHLVVAVLRRTRRARIAEGIMTSVIMMNAGKVVWRQELPGPSAWQESWYKPVEVTEMYVSTRTYRYNAAVEDDDA